MMSLARSNISHDWRMFLSAAIVLFLSGSLIYVSVGITQANIRSLTAFKRSLAVDIYIQPSDDQKLESLSQFLNESNIYPEIEYAEPLIDNNTTTTVLADGDEQELRIVALETKMPSVTVPRFINDEAKSALDVTGNTIVSSTLKSKVGFKVGDLLWNEAEDFSVKIVGYFDAEINRNSLISQAGFAFVNKETHRLFYSSATSYSARFNSLTTFSTVAIKVNPTYSLGEAVQSLSQKLQKKGLKVSTSTELIKSVSLKGALENKVLQGFLIFCFFAVLVPFFIIVQTLKSAILSQTKQFAIMKALGVRSWRLAMIAIEQSFWIGILGAALSYFGMTLLKVQFLKFNIDFFISMNTVFSVSLIIIFGSLIAGVLSIGVISKARPLDMLR